MLSVQSNKLLPKSGSSWDIRGAEEDENDAPLCRLRRVFTAHSATSRSKRRARPTPRLAPSLARVLREPLAVARPLTTTG